MQRSHFALLVVATLSAGLVTRCSSDDSAVSDGGLLDGTTQDVTIVDATNTNSDASHEASIGDASLGLDATDAADGNDGALPPYRRVFMTSKQYAANFGSLSAADTLCNSVATSAGLGGVWAAWLSSSAIAASARLEHAAVPYINLDGGTIATNWTALTTGTLNGGVTSDENGEALVLNIATQPYTGLAFTATLSDGTFATGFACADWTTAANDAGIYLAGFANTTFKNKWTQGGDYACSQTASFICVEQP